MKKRKENSKNNILNRLYYTLHTVLLMLMPASYPPGGTGTLKQRNIMNDKGVNKIKYKSNSLFSDFLLCVCTCMQLYLHIIQHPGPTPTFTVTVKFFIH